MRLNKVLKGVIVVLPILAVAACSNHGATADQHDIDGSSSNGSSYDANGYQAGGSDMSQSESARQATLAELENTNTILFGFDRYDISSDYASILDKHAAYLRNNPNVKVVIEGHADERGTPEYNIALGERRANAVRMYLQGKGVASDQISIVSYGKEKPVAMGHDESAYAKNRRAVLVY